LSCRHWRNASYPLLSLDVGREYITFGSKYAAANNGMLCTAKGAGSSRLQIAALTAKSHGWGALFTVAMTFDVLAALLALFVLKPMRAQHVASSRTALEA
jgi:OFA family oxalate/formate antiporter-like MFS transporter